MASEVAERDDNNVPTLIAVSSSNGTDVLKLYADPTSHRLLVDNSGTGGDVVGPGSSTDNAIARFDGTTGKLIQNSTVTLSDTDGTFTQTTTNGSIILTPNGTGAVVIPNGVYLWSSSPGNNTQSIQLNDSIGKVLIRGTSGGVELRASGVGATDLRVNMAGNTLLGTNTDSSNGRLQLLSHTTAAGGIGFGTDTNLFREAAGALVSTSSGATAYIKFSGSGASATYGVASTGAVINAIGSTSFILQTNTTTAVTVDSSQRTTFAGNIGVAGTTAISGLSIVLPNAGTIGIDTNNRIQFGTSGNANWTMTGALTLSTNSTTALTISSAQAATFASTASATALITSTAVGASPVIYQASNTTTGIVWPGNNQMAVNTNGARSILFDSDQTITTSSATEATTGGNGSVKLVGGIYVSKAVVSGSTTDSTTSTTGSIITAGGIGLAKNVFVGGSIIGAVQALSGAGAINVTQLTTAYTSTGALQALTLANGTEGQMKTIVHVVDGGSGVLTPTTPLGYSTITFTNAGDSVTLQYFTQGWAIVGWKGVTIV